jgi:hypothetical protein
VLVLPHLGGVSPIGSLPVALNGSGWDSEEPGAPEPEWDLDDGEFPRRRHSRFIRVVGIVTAVSLVVGTIGTTIGVFLGSGSGGPDFPIKVVSVTPPTQKVLGISARPVNPEYTEQVDFDVSNTTAHASRATCRITVMRAQSALGSISSETPSSIPGGYTAQLFALVPIAEKAFPGIPSDARVTCSQPS